MDVSVIVPTYGRRPRLERTLAALLAQDHDGAYEVIVVDDGSRDDTPALLARHVARAGGKVRAYRQPNRGPASARNRGAREATGAYLAFTDDDCVPESSWLRELKAALEKAPSPAVGGVIQMQERTWVGRYMNRWPGPHQFEGPDGSVAFGCTANFGIAKRLFHELGGFDESFYLAAFEDVEFGYRLRESGSVIAFCPSAVVRHESYYTPGQYLEMIFRYGRGRSTLAGFYPECGLSMTGWLGSWYDRLRGMSARLASPAVPRRSRVKGFHREFLLTSASSAAQVAGFYYESFLGRKRRRERTRNPRHDAPLSVEFGSDHTSPSRGVQASDRTANDARLPLRRLVTENVTL